MSPSEAAALVAIERGVAAGMSEREAEMWREAVRSPCGCAEGLALGLLVALGSGCVASKRAAKLIGFAVGAAVGKVIGTVRGLPLVRFQRAELDRRVRELATDGATSAGNALPSI
ncbi:hypothetical protein BH24ACT5_BH24ACT5_27250 [soil metagenome]